MKSTPSKDGFSLVELLVVLAVIIVLAALSLPAVSSLTRGSNLATGGIRIVDQLEYARQAAAARNCAVEFRLYQLPAAGTQAGAPSVYRAFQSFTLDADGAQTNALTKLTVLPDNIYVVDDSSVSSLLSPQAPSPSFVTGASTGQPAGAFPPASYNYVAFRFKPNGGTDLNPASAQSWHLSLAVVGDPIGSLGVPANFFTIQINAQNGRARSFRP